MTHQEYRERLGEIFLKLWNGDYDAPYEQTLAVAKQAIDRLFMDVVGEDAPEQDGWNTESREQNRLRQQIRTTITEKDGGE